MTEEVQYVNDRNVKCGGTTIQDNHPIIYLHIKDEDIACPYCGKNFIYRTSF